MKEETKTPQQILDQAREEFKKKFIRNDGLMNKYTYDEDGNPNSTGNEILSWYTQTINKLLETIINDLETNPNKDESLSFNIQHWIEAKQRQLKTLIK